MEPHIPLLFQPPAAMRSFRASAWRKRVITTIIGLSFCILLIEGNVTPREIRNQTQTPAIMMLAALPQRRMRGEKSTASTGANAVYPGAVQQDIGGFTLIELSIVLVVIGLIVGGVLVGRDLISAAAVRAQISQIQQYQQAVTTFRGKYAYLPGDIPDPDASNFGFKARGPYTTEGDGNGIIEGRANAAPSSINGGIQQTEAFMFWVDLSAARLIADSLTYAVATGLGFAPVTSTSTPATLKDFFPQAKIGGGNYIYVFSGGNTTGSWAGTGINYFGLSNITSVIAGGFLYSAAGLTVQQANAIDQKIDDGLPQGGRVTAQYVNAAQNSNISPLWIGMSDTSATSSSPTTCYDNNNVAGATQQYSITQNNGTGINCALSFKFQ